MDLKYTSPMTRTLLLLLTILALTTACTSGPPPTLVDDGRVDYQVQTRRVESDESPYNVHRLAIYRDETDIVELGAISYSDGRPNSYALSVLYTGNDWRFMDGNMIVRSGDTLLRYSEPVTRRGGYSEPVEERITVVLSPAEFEQIALGENVALEYFPGLVIEIDAPGRRASRRFFEEYGPR
jgi:hypothetical protein